MAACLADAPSVAAPPSDLVAWVHSSKLAVVVGLQAFGVSCMALWSFMLGLRAHTGGGVLSTLGALAGMAIFVIAWGGMMPLAALVYLDGVEGGPSTEVAQLCHVFIGVMINLTGLPTAASLVAFSWMSFRREAAPDVPGGARGGGHGGATGMGMGTALPVYGLAVACAHCISSCAFAHGGWLSPSGIGQFVCPPLYYVWVLWVCATLWRDAAALRRQGAAASEGSALLASHG